MPGFKRILSIDWDYFFPDSMPYDMGHSESHSPMLQEILWSIRASSHHPITGQSLFDNYVPTIPAGFWSIVTGFPQVVVADSHLKIWDVLQPLMFAQVTSLDAHHDCAYGKQTKAVVDCGSWGYWSRKCALVGRMDLWYPEWRKDNAEGYHGRARMYKPTSVNYGLPAPASYDTVFICRSGAWTPPWFDDEFLKFAGSIGHYKCLEDVSNRGISMEEARKLLAHNEYNSKGVQECLNLPLMANR